MYQTQIFDVHSAGLLHGIGLSGVDSKTRLRVVVDFGTFKAALDLDGAFENGWQVWAVFTNVAGSATTNPATLTVP